MTLVLALLAAAAAPPGDPVAFRAQGKLFFLHSFDSFSASLATDPQVLRTLKEVSPLGFRSAARP